MSWHCDGMGRFHRFLMRAPIGVYRVGLGGLLGRRFLLLEHIGRTTGLPRRAVLEVLETDAGGSPIIASGLGEASQWCRNITANPTVAVTIGRRRERATAQRLDRAAALAVFERYLRHHPRAAKLIGNKIGVSLVADLSMAADKLPLFRLAIEPSEETRPRT